MAPAEYTAFRCEGICAFPLNSNLNATNHAIMQSLVKIIQKKDDSDFPNPCCSPRILDPITVVYFDDSKTVTYKKYREMMVRSCGCN